MWLILFLLLFQQEDKKVKHNFASTDIYIPLRGRTEVILTPLPDTLFATNEYKFIMELDPKYVVSDLYFDKGLAMRTDNVLTIKPQDKSTTVDTATLRIICFSKSNRILLFHKFIVLPTKKVYPKLPKKQAFILLNNNVLERNSSYNKPLFLSNTFLQYYEEGITDSVIIEGITLSLVNRDFQKNLFSSKGILTKEMINEIKGLKTNTITYIRLDVKIGKKRKSIWTRFTMNV